MARGIGGEATWWCPSLDNSGVNTTTLNDLSGAANNGTLTNMVTSGAGNDWVADTTSGGVRALDFDGINDVVVGASQSVGNIGTSDFTICVWARVPDANGYGALAAKRNPALPFNQWGITRGNVDNTGNGVSSKKAGLFIYRGGGSVSDPAFTQNFVSTNDIWNGNWRHIAWLRSGGTTVALFVDGVSVPVTTITNGSAINPNGNFPITLGAASAAGVTSVPARIDDFRIFLRALTQSEIARLASRRGYQSISGAAVHFFTFGI